MRLTPRIASATLLGLLIVLALAPGCSSRKKVTPEANVEPPPTESVPPAPPASETTPPPSTEPTGERLTLEDAFFDFDDYSLRQDAKSALEKDGKYLEMNSAVKAVIEGHCDERGSVEYNLALGEKRALAAKTYLVSLGIPADRLRTVSYGKEFPFDPGHDEGAWSKNRRAHFVVTSK